MISLPSTLPTNESAVQSDFKPLAVGSQGQATTLQQSPRYSGLALDLAAKLATIVKESGCKCGETGDPELRFHVLAFSVNTPRYGLQSQETTTCRLHAILESKNSTSEHFEGLRTFKAMGLIRRRSHLHANPQQGVDMTRLWGCEFVLENLVQSFVERVESPLPSVRTHLGSTGVYESNNFLEMKMPAVLFLPLDGPFG